MSKPTNPEPHQVPDGSEAMRKDGFLPDCDCLEQLHTLTQLYTKLAKRIQFIRQKHIETDDLSILREENEVLKKTLNWLEKVLLLNN